MKRIPKSVKVGCHEYKLVAKTKRECPDELGKCDYDAVTISVRKRMPGNKARETLLHEILHACGYPTLLGKDEKFVDTIAPLLLQVIQDNPELMEYLLAK